MRTDRRQSFLVLLLAGASIGTTVLLLVFLTALDAPTAARDEHGVDGQAVRDFGVVSNFELLDSNAQPFKAERLDQTVWVAGFIFTRCAGPCPAITSRMAQLQADIETHGLTGRVRLVSVSVDPGHDTPAVLREYAGIAHADPDVWSFLTGSRADVASIIHDDFNLPLSTGDGPIVHSRRVALVDGRRAIRGYFDPSTSDGYGALWRAVTALVQDGAEHAPPFKQVRR